MNVESCVETSTAPEWLSKLESRREKLTKRKLGHESGAGAPCNHCGTKCPGLDLHFWRKVCRNCKCRKDQHECSDDDLTGWAQFEILGQIRSKSAYVNISAGDKPLKLDWVPPNVDTDLVLDYMKELGTEYIPISGSDAAAKRKQQLEFQVPPHDLDPSLCDNLSKVESDQLTQYVNKIKESSVGQGNIERFGMDLPSPPLPPPPSFDEFPPPPPALLENRGHTVIPTIYRDKILSHILNSDIVSGILQNPSKIINGSKLKTFDRPMKSDFDNNYLLTDKNKYKLKLMKLNTQAIQSGVLHGTGYDNLLNVLNEKEIDYTEDTLLKPIDDFRKEYRRNDQFKSNVNQFVESIGKDFLDTIPELNEEEQPDIFKTPVKRPPPPGASYQTPSDPSIWNSPLPLKSKSLLSKQGNLMLQETPMRKVNQNYNKSNIHELIGQPLYPSIEQDKILSSILHSEVVKGILNEPSKVILGTKLHISSIPMQPDFMASPHLSKDTKDQLLGMKMNSEALESAVVNGLIYDKLYPELHNRRINYSADTLLTPIERFRSEFNENNKFKNEVKNHADEIGNLPSLPSPLDQQIHPSKSNDSGFESIPPTPNYATFPGILSPEVDTLISMPGITAPVVTTPSATSAAAAAAINDLSQGIKNIQVTNNMKCQQCTLDIQPGDVVVKADRAGKDVGWHPKCFVCCKCNELLADLVYFYHNNKIYCARDLSIMLKIPRCNACDELIFTKEYTAAEGQTFHIKHFCCYNCDIPLAGKQYLPDDKTNMPLCLNCYDIYYAEKCQLCKIIIGPSEQGVAWGKVHWHANCFNCAGLNCQKSLIGGRFCVKENMPFCSPQCVKTVIFQ